MAEVAGPRELFAVILERIQWFAVRVTEGRGVAKCLSIRPGEWLGLRENGPESSSRTRQGWDWSHGAGKWRDSPP